MKNLNAFFNPKGVAIVGASANPKKLGFGLARNLLLSDYQGEIQFVNPKGGELFGKSVAPSIDSLADPVDLAVLLVPAKVIPDTLHACGRRGIPAVIVASGGFSETGQEGKLLEEQLLEIAAKYGINMIGPNCIGLLDTHLPLDTTFLPPPGPLPGDVAFISHSGAICAAVIDWARGQGFGLSRLVSLGNQIDINETDVLRPVADDHYTKVITMYLEGISDGQQFVKTASEITQEKPVIAIKVGRYESGRKAVASHTGALAGQESAFNAAFRRSGVIRVETSEEMFDWARALAWSPLPDGNRVGVLTNAGGPGATAADALEDHGLTLSELSNESQIALKQILPPAASVQNPVDMLASASPLEYSSSLQILLADENVDSVMVILPPPPMSTAAGVANAMIPMIQVAKKPVVFALMGENLIQEAVERLRAAHIPEYRFPERAAAALAVLYERGKYIRSANHQAVPVLPCDKDQVTKIIKEIDGSDMFLPEEVVQEICQAYKIPMAKLHLAETVEQAETLIEEIGFPVVMKIASPDIVHKTDAGGVRINIQNHAELRAAFGQMMVAVPGKLPDAKIDGVYLQPMVSDGQEVIVGVVQDLQFGALIMFGAGGTEVEGLRDVAFSLTPVLEQDITHFYQNTWAGKRLGGFRHIGPGDKPALKQLIAQLAQLANDFPQLTEIEINPVRVMESGEGVVAVDVRMRFIREP